MDGGRCASVQVWIEVGMVEGRYGWSEVWTKVGMCLGVDEGCYVGV